jgi:hypothetical protein
MKMDHNVAAAILLGLAAGTLQFPRGMASGNRLHTERARAGSAEELQRIADGEAKRNAKLARRAARAPK